MGVGVFVCGVCICVGECGVSFSVDFTIAFTETCTCFTFHCYSRKFDWEVRMSQMDGSEQLYYGKILSLVPGTIDWFNVLL